MGATSRATLLRNIVGRFAGGEDFPVQGGATETMSSLKFLFLLACLLGASASRGRTEDRLDFSDLLAAFSDRWEKTLPRGRPPSITDEEIRRRHDALAGLLKEVTSHADLATWNDADLQWFRRSCDAVLRMNGAGDFLWCSEREFAVKLDGIRSDSLAAIGAVSTTPSLRSEVDERVAVARWSVTDMSSALRTHLQTAGPVAVARNNLGSLPKLAAFIRKHWIASHPPSEDGLLAAMASLCILNSLQAATDNRLDSIPQAYGNMLYAKGIASLEILPREEIHRRNMKLLRESDWSRFASSMSFEECFEHEILFRACENFFDHKPDRPCRFHLDGLKKGSPDMILVTFPPPLPVS